MHDGDYAHDLQNVNACLTPRCYRLIYSVYLVLSLKPCVTDPLQLLGSNVTEDRKGDSGTTFVLARTPSLGF